MPAHTDMAACLGRSVRSVVAGARPGNKQELEGGLMGSSAPCQSPLASSCVASGIQPCSPPEPVPREGLPQLGLHC